MIKVNDIVYYKTPEGLVEVAITQLNPTHAKIIWNEKGLCGCIQGKDAIVSVSKLKEIK